MSSSKGGGPKRFLALLILSSLLLALYWRTPDFLAACELKLHDLLLGRAPVPRADSSACVILIGGRSSEKTPGTDAQAVARIIDAIAQGNPRAIGACDCLNGTDAVLETSVRSARKAVIGYRFSFDDGEASAETLGAVEKSRLRFVTNPWGKARRRATAPRLSIACADTRAVDAAAGCGFSNITPDVDGVARGVSLVEWAKDTPYQGFLVALLAVSLGADRVTLRLKGEAIQGIDIGGLRVSTDSRGRLLFREYAGETAYPASDLLEGKLRPGLFSGKIVLIGSNSRRLRTRFSPSVPEAVIQATAIENALRGDYLRRSRGVGLLEIALMVGIPFTVSRSRGWRRWCAMLGALILIVGCAAVLLACCGQEMRTLFPTASIILAWLAPSARLRP